MSDRHFMLAETSDEDSPSLAIGRDDEGRVVVSVMSQGSGAAIALSDEQLKALLRALREV